MTRLVADLDDPLQRLDDPAFAALRRSAFDRWAFSSGDHPMAAIAAGRPPDRPSEHHPSG
jgi:hypothetical protein